MKYMLIIFVLVLSIIYISSCVEKFEIERKREGNNIQLGFLNNTPGPIKDLMTSLNKIGTQMREDSEYDTVETDYLERENIP